MITMNTVGVSVTCVHRLLLYGKWHRLKDANDNVKQTIYIFRNKTTTKY